MTTAMLSFDYRGLHAGFAFAAILFSLLLLAVVALMAGFTWRRFRPADFRWPVVLFRISLGCSSLLFVISLSITAHAGFTGFFRGFGDALSFAFWIFASGVVAFTACRFSRKSRRATELTH